MKDILQELNQLYDARGDEIEAWLGSKRKEIAPHIYNSVDLRHSGLKLVPVDTNLFPAGFNNLSEAGLARSAHRFKDYFKEHGLEGGNILIIPENHTRNLGYLENLAILSDVIEQAGAKVQIGSLAAPSGEPLSLTTLSGRQITEYPLRLVDGFIETESGFRPHLVVMNNDLTSGRPPILENLRQPLVPPMGVGWYRRRKSVHFTAYNTLAEDFANVFGIDSWLISTHFHGCGMVNFSERVGLECVAKGVEKVLAATREKYKEYGVSEDPYVFIKADSGTYGMGIMTAKSGEDVLSINKKTRNKMDVIKEGTHNTEVIIQEGVPTIDRVNGLIAEPMLYLVDGVPVGGAYRVNAERDAYSNLNAAGMQFTGMCDEQEGDSERVKIMNCNFRVFGLIAAIASLAAAREEAIQSGGGI